MVAPAAPPDFASDLQPYLAKHCLRCHDAKKQKGDLRIDTLSPQIGLKDTSQWAEIVSRITSGEMPPEDEKERPSTAENARVIEWISARIKEGEAARLAKRDRVSFHRLTREEYAHTLSDLLGVEVDLHDSGGFYEDVEWNGFSRIGAAMSLSVSHMEKYFQFAEKVVAEAYPDAPARRLEQIFPAVSPGRITGSFRAYLEAKGLRDKVRLELWPNDKMGITLPEPREPHAPGVYECKITLSALPKPGAPPPRIRVEETSLRRTLLERDVVAPEDQPVTLTFYAHLPEGPKSTLITNLLENGGTHLPPVGGNPIVSLKEPRLPWLPKVTTEDGTLLYGLLLIDRVEWRGPLVSEATAALRSRGMPSESAPESVQKALRHFAQRAFRRPPTDSEIQQLQGIVEKEVQGGASLRAAMRSAMVAVLCSRSFLFLEEGSPAEERQRLTDWELASRLSYFLWSTMPDEELVALAAAGRLRDPAMLKKQVARMLADPRSGRLSESFAGQWLRLKKVGMFPPDRRLYPDYDKYLEKSMIGETIAFFGETLAKNHSLREFLHSDWTMLNARLARHYGLDEPAGDSFQRVLLPAHAHRGGLLTQAAILSLTSDGIRHRPVHRGVWLSESILGKTPPPPPPNVDPIPPTPGNSPKATLRSRLDAHKTNASCASCHVKIDPLGLAFENYDAIGRWRTHEVVPQGVGAMPPVDASGQLHNGHTFQNAEEFKALLVRDLDTFAKTFVRKLATYGLRRAVTFDDEVRIQSIVDQSKPAGYGVRSIVEALVVSDLFLHR
ncbi:MAG: hypothetical protein RLZZ399_3006 [Verrucomicrobiota bacterium]|jgi:hypothetical protein